MKKLFQTCFYFFLLIFSISSLANPAIYQAGTMIGLMNGIYTGSTSFAELAKYGDIGLGTSNGLGGELVEIDRKFYLADSDGNAKPIVLSEKTPFAQVAQFTPHEEFTLENINSLEQLEDKINQHLSSQNVFYVIKVDGHFSNIKARSVIPPSKPYPPLDEVAKNNQKIFYVKDTDASLIIFKSPGFILPLPGYHVHFISDDRKKAGHVFDVNLTHAKVAITQINEYVLILPNSEEFMKANIIASKGDAVAKIENGK